MSTNVLGTKKTIAAAPYFHVNTDPVDVLIQWAGGERTLVNDVNSVYVTLDGRVTFRRYVKGSKSVRLGLVVGHKRYRVGKVEMVLSKSGAILFNHIIHTLASGV